MKIQLAEMSFSCCHKRKALQQQDPSKSLAVAMTSVERSQQQLAGNLNAAFAESTLTLSVDVKDKDKDKDNQWPTAIVVQRY